MITICGYNEFTTKNGKDVVAIYFKDDGKRITYGEYCSEVICSKSYAEKILSHDGEIRCGYSPAEKRRFLYIPKEA